MQAVHTHEHTHTHTYIHTRTDERRSQGESGADWGRGPHRSSATWVAPARASWVRLATRRTKPPYATAPAASGGTIESMIIASDGDIYTISDTPAPSGQRRFSRQRLWWGVSGRPGREISKGIAAPPSGHKVRWHTMAQERGWWLSDLGLRTDRRLQDGAGTVEEVTRDALADQAGVSAEPRQQLARTRAVVKGHRPRQQRRKQAAPQVAHHPLPRKLHSRTHTQTNKQTKKHHMNRASAPGPTAYARIGRGRDGVRACA
jgi:hypothetical protein